jgi:uncharacterized membrane protein
VPAQRTLSTPKSRRFTRPHVLDSESFGTWSEQFARYMGTSKFLLQMTGFIALWLLWNTVAPAAWQFDPYTFTFLTLLLSLQASYAAPLILLAQNRQDDRDRAEARNDRDRAAMGVEINSYLARELSEMQGKLNDISVDINTTLKAERTERGARKKATQRERELTDRLDRIEQAVASLVAQADTERIRRESEAAVKTAAKAARAAQKRARSAAKAAAAAEAASVLAAEAAPDDPDGPRSPDSAPLPLPAAPSAVSPVGLSNGGGTHS